VDPNVVVVVADADVGHRVKWKLVYGRLSSQVNPDHGSIAPQTGDPRPFLQPFRPLRDGITPPFSHREREASFIGERESAPFAPSREIEIDGVTRPAGTAPSSPRLPWSENDTRRDIFVRSERERDRGREGGREKPEGNGMAARRSSTFVYLAALRHFSNSSETTATRAPSPRAPFSLPDDQQSIKA